MPVPSPDQGETPSPVELALDAALIVMRNGGPTESVDRTFRNVLKGLGADDVPVVWRLDFVAVHGGAGSTATALRPVGPLGVNLWRASEAVVLGERAARGGFDPAELRSGIARIGAMPSPYNRWVMTAASAVAAAAFSL